MYINKVFNRFLLIYLTSVSIIFLAACSKKEQKMQEKLLRIQGIEATGPYLTQDHLGRPVLCWTEKDGKDSLYRLKYAVYHQERDSIGNAITIPGSIGCSASAESMGKVAFKDDGTVVALFAKSFPKERNPYAGAIYYSMSSDAGQNWTKPVFLHSDTAHVYGRNFFDITRLKDGELATIWLDGRFAKQIKGSSLFFSRTNRGTGFTRDTCLEKGTCECCRTNIIADEDGNIHLAYRGIQFPSALSGKQVRDMVYKKSSDGGKNFTEAEPLSIDNWEIDGCPHSGPSMALRGKALQAVWYTAGGSSGIYTTSSAPQNGFIKRQLLTAEGRHPQLTAFSADKTLMVCEESIQHNQEAATDHGAHQHHPGMKMSHASAALAKIVLRVLENGKIAKTFPVTDGTHADHHAVLRLVDHGLLIAWVRDEPLGSRIYFSNMHFSAE